MSKNRMKQIQPYEGDQPYLYFAFAEEDCGRVRKLLRPLLARGCRVWFCVGAAGSAEELLHRQERYERAALTLVYLTDALCADRDSKSAVLVNQKFNRPIVCLDPDEKDRRLAMNLRETIPHIPLYKLSEDEWAVLRTHPAKGYQICMSTQELSPIARMVLCHHERWDGKGYPEQIAGERIPVLSRIISIVDAYDAMVNDRPYRKGLSVEAAQEEIRRCAGTQFDPALAEEFLTLLREHPELAEGERTGAPEIGILFQSFTQEEEDGNTFPVLYSRYVLDVEERIEEVDETFTLLTGYSREQAAGMLQFDLIPPEERANYIVTVSNMLSRGNLVFLQHEILKKDGSRISVLCMGKKYYDSALKAYRSEILITPARNE